MLGEILLLDKKRSDVDRVPGYRNDRILASIREQDDKSDDLQRKTKHSQRVM